MSVMAILRQLRDNTADCAAVLVRELKRQMGPKQLSPVSDFFNGIWLELVYLHSTLKSSKLTVTVPAALKVICAVSCTLKLFPGPWPIISNLFMNVSLACPFWSDI